MKSYTVHIKTKATGYTITVFAVDSDEAEAKASLTLKPGEWVDRVTSNLFNDVE